MRPIGFSTGALARGDFRKGLSLLQSRSIEVVELSALRMEELEPLLTALPGLNLSGFKFVSIHAPSSFGRELENRVVELLDSAPARRFPVVVHPDVIFTPSIWRRFGTRLLIENMDKRKPIGRTLSELRALFDLLPEAKFCFDIGHARQVDPTMTEAALLVRNFRHLLAEVHLSEVNTASRHDPISRNATLAFQKIAGFIPCDTPIVLETLIDAGQSDIDVEIERGRQSLPIEDHLAA